MNIVGDTPTLMALLRAIVTDAGGQIEAIAQRAINVHYKADESPVTAADIAAQSCICQALQTYDAHIPILSEEKKLPDWSKRQHWQRYWLIDPLDGTREFIAQTGEYTVNIALIVSGKPVLGVVYLPALDMGYIGGGQIGAWRWQAAQPFQAIRVRPCPTAGLSVVMSKRHAVAETQAFLQQLSMAACYDKGSSLKFCQIAQGDADLYPRLAAIAEWDIAAGQAVLEGAGGGVFDLTGQSLRYNQQACVHTPPFLACAQLNPNWLNYFE